MVEEIEQRLASAAEALREYDVAGRRCADLRRLERHAQRARDLFHLP